MLERVSVCGVRVVAREPCLGLRLRQDHGPSGGASAEEGFRPALEIKAGLISSSATKKLPARSPLLDQPMNSQALATVFLGLTVRVADLIAASWAFPTLEPALRAIGLLQLRQRRGTLASSNGGGAVLGRVPVEVWDAIQSELIARAVRSARGRVQQDRQCQQCEDLGVYGRVLSFGERNQVEGRATRARAEQKAREEQRLAKIGRQRAKYRRSRVNDPEWVDHSEKKVDGCDRHWFWKLYEFKAFADSQLHTRVSSSQGA